MKINGCSIEIPRGWETMLEQMLTDIKEDIKFIQIKEKYNQLRCCYEGQISKESQNILYKYSEMSRYVCSICGQPAYIETYGYITSLCEDCKEKNITSLKYKTLPLDFHFYRIHNKKDIRHLSFENEWNKYLKRIGEKNDY